MRRIGHSAALALFLASGAPAEEAPRRVVSANLCADGLLLALAERSQIASLSLFAADPRWSSFLDDARGLPTNRGAAEELVALRADLALIGSHDSRYTRALLAEKGVAFLALDPWTSLDDGKRQIRDVAARLGHPERGAALAAAIDRAMDGIAGAAARPARVLVLHRRGYVPGRLGVLGEVLSAAGLVDVGRELGVGDGAFVSLERLIALKPDYLVVSGDVDAPEDQGVALLAHPALAGLYPPEKRLVAPDRLTICGGPSTPDMIGGLAAEIRAKVR